NSTSLRSPRLLRLLSAVLTFALSSPGNPLRIVSLHAQQQAQALPLQRLQAAIERTTKSVNATWGIYVKSLESGEEISIDADRQMETMSTIKIPLMIEAFAQIKAGKFGLADKYTFVQADSQPGTGTIQRLDPGAVMTVKDLITMKIVVSDNTDRKSTRLNSSHLVISYAVFCLKKKNTVSNSHRVPSR